MLKTHFVKIALFAATLAAFAGAFSPIGMADGGM
jgi:hypothetical protein